MKLLRRNLTRSPGFSSPAPPAQHSAITDAWSATQAICHPASRTQAAGLVWRNGASNHRTISPTH